MNKRNFATSFWGEGDRGLEVLMNRMRAGKHVSEEVHALLKERASIEEDYGKRLAKLAKTFSTREEIGTTKDALDVVRVELESSARAHLDVANEIRGQLEKPLAEFLANQSGIRKNHNAVVEKHLKLKSSMMSTVLKQKDKYEKYCNEVNQLMQTKPGLQPKEMEKVKAKLEKAQSNARSSDLEYLNSVEKLQDVHRKWEEDFRTACKECQKLEEDRIDYLRSTLWNYANMLSSLCVSDDESCERIRKSLERCVVDKDIDLFLDTSTTGTEVPPPLRYINFYTKTSDRPMNAGPSSSNSRSNSTNVYGSTSDSVQSISEYRPDNNTSASSRPSVISNGDSNSNNVNGGSSGGGGGGFAATFGSMFKPLNTERMNSGGGATGGATSGGGDRGGNMGSSLFTFDSREDAGISPTSEASYQYDMYDFPSDVPVLFQVRVLYDYAAQALEELTIARNQIIPVIEQHDDGWWEGIVMENGKKRKGLFPSNFVEKC
ncbi:hypothetical protein HDU76_012862 [Blyttiomyces sp. JEL0837]|nr:hypothetical protein HDU76_012862 [Blyttiomyces sp. JEL0837]